MIKNLINITLFSLLSFLIPAFIKCMEPPQEVAAPEAVTIERCRAVITPVIRAIFLQNLTQAERKNPALILINLGMKRCRSVDEEQYMRYQRLYSFFSSGAQLDTTKLFELVQEFSKPFEVQDFDFIHQLFESKSLLIWNFLGNGFPDVVNEAVASQCEDMMKKNPLIMGALLGEVAVFSGSEPGAGELSTALLYAIVQGHAEISEIIVSRLIRDQGICCLRAPLQLIRRLLSEPRYGLADSIKESIKRIRDRFLQTIRSPFLIRLISRLTPQENRYLVSEMADHMAQCKNPEAFERRNYIALRRKLDQATPDEEISSDPVELTGHFIITKREKRVYEVFKKLLSHRPTLTELAPTGLSRLPTELFRLILRLLIVSNP